MRRPYGGILRRRPHGRTDAIEDYRAHIGCLEVVCEACLEVAPMDRTERFFCAACVEGQCAVRDRLTSTLTECNTAADRQLQCGAGCCGSCRPDQVVAFRRDEAVTAELCGSERAGCDACACDIPSTVAADCVDGRCVVTGEPVCTVGADQTCNANALRSSISGTCNADGTCTCNEGRQPDRTGRCE